MLPPGIGQSFEEQLTKQPLMTAILAVQLSPGTVALTCCLSAF